MIDINSFMIGIYVAALFTTAMMGVFVFVRLKSEKRGYFVFFIFCVIIQEMGLLFEMMAQTTDGGFIATMVTYSGAMLICPTFLMFVQKYCDKDLPPICNVLIFASAIFIIGLVWTSQHHTLYYTDMEFSMEGPVHTLRVGRGILYPLGDLHPTVCMIVTVAMLVQKMRRIAREKRKRIAILIFCAVAPALSQLLTLFNISFYGVDATTFFLLAAIIVAYFGLIRYDLLENEETIRIKKDFLQDLNHELRTPLAVVGSGIDLIDGQLKGEESDPELLSRTIGTIRNQTQRIGRMLDGMLELATMNETAANRQKVQPANLLLNSVEAFRIDYEKRGIVLVAELEPNLPDIFVQRDRISQVVSNLLSNSLRHTSGGQVKLTAMRDGQFVRVCIQDTGGGVPEELLPEVFMRGVSGSGGTGYGLFICKAIIEAHGGTIKIENVKLKMENYKTDELPCGNPAEGEPTDTQMTGARVIFTIPVYGGQEVGRK